MDSSSAPYHSSGGTGGGALLRPSSPRHLKWLCTILAIVVGSMMLLGPKEARLGENLVHEHREDRIYFPHEKFAAILKLRGGDLESEKNRGNALFQQGKYDQAKEVYTRALNSASDRKDEVALAILRNRAATNMKLGDYKGAIKDSTEVLDVKICNKALLRRAMAIDKLGDLSMYEMGYRDARKLLMDGEGATGTETLREVKRLEEKMRKAWRATLMDDCDKLCKNCYEDAKLNIEFENMHLVDKAIEDLDYACDRIVEKRDANFSAEWPWKCVEMRMQCHKMTSCFESLTEDLNFMVNVSPKNATLRLLRCFAYEACERWPRCLKEAKLVAECQKGIDPTPAQILEAQGYVKRMTYFVEQLSSKDRGDP